jgi:signal transduction histidine kinase
MKTMRARESWNTAEPDLQVWRTRALRAVLAVVAAAAFPAYVSLIANAVLSAHSTPLLWVYSCVYVAFVLLAFLPRIEVNHRAWILFILAYVNAAASFARVGLAGSGRLYLLILPAAAIVLVGPRGGYLCLGISLAIYAGFALLARAGILAGWLTEPSNPLSTGFWIEAGAALAVFLLTLTVLMERFYTRHLHTLATRNLVTAELEKAYAAMERRVRDRTRELGLLNDVAGVASGLTDLCQILRVSLEKTMEAFGFENGGAYGLEQETGTLVMLAHKGLSEELAARMTRLPMETALAGKELSLEQPLSWSFEEYPEGALRRFIEAEGLRRIVGVPLAAKGCLVGGMVLSSRQDRSLAPEEGALLIAVGRQIGLAIENARLLEAERIDRDDANRRREVAEGLRETLAILNSNRPLQEILDFIIAQACRLMNCDASALLQLESREGPLRIRAACGLDMEQVSAVQLSLGREGAGRALAWRKPMAVSDASGLFEGTLQDPHPDFAEDLMGLELLMNQGYRAILSVPLVVQNEIYGGISLYYREPRRFGAEEIELATGIGSQAALAIENARLRTQAEKTAAFAERNRLARELHDSVTQSVYSVTLYAEAAARLLQGGKIGDAAEHLRELGTTAREALREMRLLIFELSPPALETGSLADALRTRLDAVEARGGVSVNFRVDGGEQLSPLVRQELYQIAQEALNNALKHSRAQAVRILLRFGEQETGLEISDDGVGFDLEQAQKCGGLGLRGMRERVQRIAGALRLDSAPGAGTRISVTAPASGRT